MSAEFSSTNICPMRRSLSEPKLEMLRMDLAARGMRCQCNEYVAKFELPNGFFAVFAKTDSPGVDACTIIDGGFTDIDRTALVRFADACISHYRRCHAIDLRPVPSSARASLPLAIVPAGEEDSLAEWCIHCTSLPATGGRGILNPGRFCYLNAAIAALSACPVYGELIQTLSSRSPEESVVSRLAAVFRALNDLIQPPLRHFDTVVEQLALSLVSAGCPIPVTDYREMDDSGSLLQFMLRAAGTQFLIYDIQNGSDIVEVPLLMPTLPEWTVDGDDRINLEECLSSFVFASEAPRLLPIWLRRATHDEEGGMLKVERPCYFPLSLKMIVRNGDVVEQVQYFLRSVILHRGHSATSGHYLTVVPTPDGMMKDTPYPILGEVRNDSKPKVQKLGSLFKDMLKNGVCYLYERMPKASHE